MDKKKTDEEIKSQILERIKSIENPKAGAFYQLHPDYPKNQKEIDRIDIICLLRPLELIHQSIMPHIHRLKSLIKSITEKTPICAVYLLLGKIMQAWETIFLIAKKGKNQEVMELSRSINENLDLISLLIFSHDVNDYLDRWFNGEIIENRKAREEIDKFINCQNLVSQESIPIYEMDTHIYRILSKYTHGSYAALLDSVDVFNKDFDFNGFAGFNYTKRNFHVLESAMVKTLLELKTLYLFLKDDDSYKKINDMLIKVMPNTNKEEIESVIKKFK